MPSDHKSNHQKNRQGVFISYARSDGKEFANRLRQQLEAEGFGSHLWQDLIGMEGGRAWWLQITEALDHVAFMALVITPNALLSPIVRQEWRYARQQGVCVYPIKGAPDLDFNSMPRWMREQHFYDLSEKLGWEKFIADLKRSCETPRVPFMVDDLPEDFVERPGEFDQLLALLLDDQREEPVAITAALRGAGGYGKTTLAKALCHHEEIQDAFDDGILWVTLGENPGERNFAAVKMRQVAARVPARDSLPGSFGLGNNDSIFPIVVHASNLGAHASRVRSQVVRSQIYFLPPVPLPPTTDLPPLW